MRKLVIETASEACSIALFDGDKLVAADHRVLGRGHAERLIPMVGALPDRGKADEIYVSLGPGSFTGTRIGLAAARALGVAWSARVEGFPTLAIVAAAAREKHEENDLLVVMAGGHGEFFVQPFDATGLPRADHASLKPEAAVERFADEQVFVGNRAEAFVDLRGSGQALEILPDARAFPVMPAELHIAKLAPIYGRPPDAKAPV
ncbi:tRNA (adenosine(37)-N6)-threonylcarbamoyltransferase complex dimerization subunit type 1 TsaB [Altererythrobacter aurantiacus]|uniref:tRNA (Adenosine(37)-N6)-threonylcarbamoyltransferase complex dimerization subunit type 1 TsaB n=1 Tax=Parapontixanthobacter aurantiacus TaxID=1463599 RepID=A0A844ZFC2_9SPHN|nr:tRNA (adenosine(37)-N6)-threonylcarbamoyltransferase complex dimerization subunit type 1 TsaB [Parapontixanthobacter aurantiacus]MXO85670.1 tRNA (adenosine(37)-N6)-threonylcarbamoyltransferase complex dimerization subunit type 1 TsaB [Parapontixanthobacter aurantiacus]